MDVQELIDEGLELLEISDYEGALKIGRRIIDLHHSYGFEIAARAYRGLEKNRKAVRTIEDGLKVAPQAWPLWQLLGNYSSDDENYARAYAAYDRALACPNVDPSSVHLNYAIALRREGRVDEALSHLDRVTDGETLLPAAMVHAEILVDREQYDDAIAVARAGLAFQGEDDNEDRARLHAAIARACFHQGLRSEALKAAWDAITWHRGNESAQWMIREIHGQRSKDAKVYHLTLRGRWHEPIDEEGTRDYYMGFSVVADDPQEALQLAAPFEEESERGALTVKEAKVKRKCGTELPKGVYWTGGRVFFLETDA